jgi:hypothetical protein
MDIRRSRHIARRGNVFRNHFARSFYMELTRRKFIASTGAAMSAVVAAPIAPAGFLVDRSPIQPITIVRLHKDTLCVSPRVSIFGIGSGGHDAIAHISKMVFSLLVREKPIIERVNEAGIGDCENSHMAIFLIGEGHTSMDLRRAGEIAYSLKRKGLLVTVITSRPTLTSASQKNSPSGFACNSWISALGTKGLVDTATAILLTMYGDGLIGFDFQDLRSVLDSGAGSATTIYVPYHMVDDEVPFPQDYSNKLMGVLHGAKRVMIVIVNGITLFGVDCLVQRCRRYMSGDQNWVFRDGYDEQCVMPRLTVIGT